MVEKMPPAASDTATAADTAPAAGKKRASASASLDMVSMYGATALLYAKNSSYWGGLAMFGSLLMVAFIMMLNYGNFRALRRKNYDVANMRNLPTFRIFNRVLLWLGLVLQGLLVLGMMGVFSFVSISSGDFAMISIVGLGVILTSVMMFALGKKIRHNTSEKNKTGPSSANTSK